VKASHPPFSLTPRAGHRPGIFFARPGGTRPVRCTAGTRPGRSSGPPRKKMKKMFSRWNLPATSGVLKNRKLPTLLSLPAPGSTEPGVGCCGPDPAHGAGPSACTCCLPVCRAPSPGFRTAFPPRGEGRCRRFPPQGIDERFVSRGEPSGESMRPKRQKASHPPFSSGPRSLMTGARLLYGTDGESGPLEDSAGRVKGVCRTSRIRNSVKKLYSAGTK